MRVRRSAILRVVTVAVCAAVAVTLGAARAPAAPGGHVLYVSTHRSTSDHEGSCRTAPYTSIGSAVAAASSGGTVVVCPGTYQEDVVIKKPLTLIGIRATINADGLENAIQVVSSNVTVRGFTLTDANGEGLLVGIDSPADFGLLPSTGPVLENVVIDRVQAIDNDEGFNGTEQGNCKYPGDCGGGIHLNVVKHSVVRNSVVNDNADGILLTDDYGPNAYNLIENDVVNDNKTECGIVLASHSSTAVTFNPTTFAVTGRNPEKGGLYGNVIRHNRAIGNGTALAPPQFGGLGSGAGIGIFGSGPGSAAYDNTVIGNYLAGNGLAGVTLHAHHPGGEDINGNSIIGNWFETNNVAGDGFDGGVKNVKTTAVAVYSVPEVRMTIRGNVFRHNAIGVWLTTTVHASGLDDNSYRDIGTRVVTSPPN